MSYSTLSQKQQQQQGSSSAALAGSSTNQSSVQTIPTKTSLECLNFINFNQDGSCISIGTDRGYKIFNCEPFGKCYSRLDGGIGIVEMLFCTSLIAIVGLGDQPSMTPRRLKIINTKRHSTICELTFPTSILSVKLNKSRLVVLLEEQIYIYDINNMRLLHTIETSPNPNGLCALSPTIDNNFLAYPSPPKISTNFINPINSSNNINNNGNGNNANSQLNNIDSNSNSKTTNQINRNGDVIIFNAQTLQPLVVVEAHKTTLAAIAISFDGTLLATASDKGTIVRVFAIETGLKLYQFRRGTYPTKIYSLSFSQDNKFLTASSATETVHIFKLGSDDDTSNNTQSQPDNEAIDADDIVENIGPSIVKRAESSGSEVSQDTTQRRISNSSYDSINSNEIEDRVEPLIDISRRSVGRMIRKSSQNIGRKAAEKIGTFLPPRFTSMLEPTRHFASLKVPAASGVKNVVSIGKELSIPKSGLPSVFSEQSNSNDQLEGSEENTFGNSGESSSTSQDNDNNLKLIHVSVVSSEGYFYNYGLDPERGGDCILLNQYSLTDSQ